MAGDRPVDTGQAAVDTAAALYTDAGDSAAHRWPHQGAPGSPVVRYGGGYDCGGKLLTAYVRETGPIYRDKPKWVKVGVICRKCGQWWPAPASRGAF